MSIAHTRVRTARAGLLGVLVPEDIVEPIHKPDEIWTRCPCCERGGPNRLALTISLGSGALNCRNGCPPERIGERLANRTPPNRTPPNRTPPNRTPPNRTPRSEHR